MLERTVLGLVLLVGLHGLVGSGTTDDLVAELGLVLLGDLGADLKVLKLLVGPTLVAVSV